jgi:hypothetical protein
VQPADPSGRQKPPTQGPPGPPVSAEQPAPEVQARRGAQAPPTQAKPTPPAPQSAAF